MGNLSRREFLASGVAAGVVVGTSGTVCAPQKVKRTKNRIYGHPPTPIKVRKKKIKKN